MGACGPFKRSATAWMARPLNRWTSPALEHKHANELSDAELANIATGRSTGAAEPQEGETVLN
jgi:hypothetical protein